MGEEDPIALGRLGLASPFPHAVCGGRAGDGGAGRAHLEPSGARRLPLSAQRGRGRGCRGRRRGPGTGQGGGARRRFAPAANRRSVGGRHVESDAGHRRSAERYVARSSRVVITHRACRARCPPSDASGIADHSERVVRAPTAVQHRSRMIPAGTDRHARRRPPNRDAVPRAPGGAARDGRAGLHQRHAGVGPGGDDAARRRRRCAASRPPSSPRSSTSGAPPPALGELIARCEADAETHGGPRRGRQPAQPAPRLRPRHAAAHGAGARDGGGEHAGHARAGARPASATTSPRSRRGWSSSSRSTARTAERAGRARGRRAVRRAAGELRAGDARGGAGPRVRRAAGGAGAAHPRAAGERHARRTRSG